VNIGIDCNPIMNKKTGVGNYMHNLLLELAKIDKTNSYTLFFYSLRNLDITKAGQYNFKYKKTVSLRIPRLLLDFFWNNLRFPPIEFFIGRVNIFHGNFYLPPMKKGVNGIITIYDMSFFDCPEFHTKATQRFRSKVLKSHYIASKIVTISDFSKSEILKYINIPEEKIEVIYPGVSLPTEVKLKRNEDDILKKYSLSKKYILYVGTIEPRKNLEGLIKAYKLLLSDDKYKNKYDLVIVGKLGWKYETFFKTLENLDLQDKVKRLGYIPDEELPAIYKHTSLFVYPSIYEGFGLPVLEAMAYGVPVITSNISSLPEVAGDAALLINPYNYKEIRDGIADILSTEQLKSQLIARGKDRVKKFPWRKTAEKTLEIYKKVYNGV